MARTLMLDTHDRTEDHGRFVRALSADAASGGEMLCRSRNFLVSWMRCGPGPAVSAIMPDHEYLLLLPDSGASISFGGVTTHAPAHAVVIVPAGPSIVTLAGEGRCIRLFAPVPLSGRDAIVLPGAGPSIGMSALRAPLPGFRRADSASGVVVHVLADYPNSPGMPRAKLFQTATISINWVEYEGPRDRSKLSPHAHTDFEQGSLALEGRFLHHLRTPWTPDANTWMDDAHISCGADTLAIIPPPIEHTTEGIGEEKHVLIDIFSPPRRDFIARGQVLNSTDYHDMEGERA